MLDFLQVAADAECRVCTRVSIIREAEFVGLVGLDPSAALSWLLVEGFSLSYHHQQPILFTIDPYHGNLNYIP